MTDLDALTLRLTEADAIAFHQAVANYADANTERDRAERAIVDHHLPAWYSSRDNEARMDEAAHTIAALAVSAGQRDVGNQP